MLPAHERRVWWDADVGRAHVLQQDATDGWKHSQGQQQVHTSPA